MYGLIIKNGKISTVRLEWYEAIEAHNYITQQKFDTEDEALDYASHIVVSLPVPHPAESDAVYARRCRR